MAKYGYYNRNPHKLRLKDCVCRAISTATGLKYEAVDNLLELTAKEHECEKLCVCCYDNLLEELLCYPRHECQFQRTVLDVATQYPRSKLIIRVEGHLTCAVRGNVLDIWDCAQELADCFWIVE